MSDETDRDTYDPDAILADPNSHPIHKMYANINIGIRDRGERWAKCANCGYLYRVTEAWSSGTVCSEPCEGEFNYSLTYGDYGDR